jgi:hypothetical protein
MAVNKNFVVKNGVEVSTDLIYADNSIDKVGIGTTTPAAKLEVIGDIVGVGLTLSGSTTGTDANYSGIVTASSGLEVGSGGTSITVDVTNNSIGFNTTTPDTRYVLDVQAGAGQSAANFGGGVDIEGDLSVTGSISGNITIVLNDEVITGVVTANDAEIYTQFDIVNNSNVAYQYQATGIGFTQNTDNPILYLIRGKKYHFNLNASGHPFYIKKPEAGIGSVGTTLLYDDGVEGQGTQVGILTFKVPYNGPSNVYYQCSTHTGMGNTMYLLDGTGTGGGGGGSTGISSVTVMEEGTIVGVVSTINFTGTGASVAAAGDRININVGQGGGLSSAISYDDGSESPFSYIDQTSYTAQNITFDNTNAGPGTSYVLSGSPILVVNSGIAVTVGTSKTMIIDPLNLAGS